jgi:hypothetical protein
VSKLAAPAVGLVGPVAEVEFEVVPVAVAEAQVVQPVKPVKHRLSRW